PPSDLSPSWSTTASAASAPRCACHNTTRLSYTRHPIAPRRWLHPSPQPQPLPITLHLRRLPADRMSKSQQLAPGHILYTGRTRSSVVLLEERRGPLLSVEGLNLHACERRYDITSAWANGACFGYLWRTSVICREPLVPGEASTVGG